VEGGEGLGWKGGRGRGCPPRPTPQHNTHSLQPRGGQQGAGGGPVGGRRRHAVHGGGGGAATARGEARQAGAPAGQAHPQRGGGGQRLRAAPVGAVRQLRRLVQLHRQRPVGHQRPRHVVAQPPRLVLPRQGLRGGGNRGGARPPWQGVPRQVAGGRGQVAGRRRTCMPKIRLPMLMGPTARTSEYTLAATSAYEGAPCCASGDSSCCAACRCHCCCCCCCCASRAGGASLQMPLLAGHAWCVSVWVVEGVQACRGVAGCKPRTC
jgi:hypothetical protein